MLKEYQDKEEENKIRITRGEKQQEAKNFGRQKHTLYYTIFTFLFTLKYHMSI